LKNGADAVYNAYSCHSSKGLIIQPFAELFVLNSVRPRKGTSAVSFYFIKSKTLSVLA
jgi:uncharacterized protein YcgI (DUF1989 family)